MNSNFKIVDHSNLDLAIALCRSKYTHTDITDFSHQSFFDSIKLINCALFSSDNSCNLREQKRLANLCVILQSNLVDSDDDTHLIADSLASFWTSFLELMPFMKGNHFTVRKFLVEFTQSLQKLNIVVGYLDFRSLPTHLFTDKPKDEITDIFYHQLSTKQVDTLWPKLQDERWQELPDSSVEIAGHKFLTYQNNFLLTQNGGLINTEFTLFALERFLKKGGHPSEFTVERDAIETYLFNNGAPISALDGIAFGESIPLVCLTTDYLTGLDINTELPILAKLMRHHRFSILDIPELTLEHPILTERIRKRITNLRRYIHIIAKRFFQDKIPADKISPQFFLSMGGIGSGKSSLLKYAEKVALKNLVHISADNARATSKLYDFYIKCAHHSDDYKSLTLFSATLIAEVTSIAMREGYHYFRDATGIPYEGRYDELVALFKHVGFETHLLSASAPLFVERDRKDMDKPVSQRIWARYKKKKRLVPWSIVVDKHIHHPKAFLDALVDANLGNILLYDTMMKKGDTKMMAFTMEVSKRELTQISESQAISSSYCLHTIFSIQTNSELKKLLKKSKPQLLHIYQCNLIKNDKVRILVILDKIKFIDFMQKSCLYERAIGYSSLVYNQFMEHNPAIDYPEYHRSNDETYRLRNQVIKDDAYLY